MNNERRSSDVTHIAVNQARRAWSGSGVPEEFVPILSTSPSHRSFIRLADTDGFLAFKKLPGVVISPAFERKARVERS